MLRDRSEPVDLFALVPALELRFEPELAELDGLLDDDELFQHIKADLSCRFPHTLQTGRPSTPVEVVLRLLVVQHLYAWSYEQTEHFVGDSLVLRQFCRLGVAPAPHATTLLRWANLVQPATMHRLLDRVTELARELKVTRGRKLRLDSTVVPTAIHYPTDSSLLVDGVRVLSRWARRAAQLLGNGSGLRVRDRTRSARRLARRIDSTAAPHAATPSRAERPALYARLLGIARASVRQAEQAQQLVADLPSCAAARVRSALARLQPLVQQVVQQTARRVLRGDAVPAADKLVSLFEPHSVVIRRGKARLPAEFGRKVALDEVDGGLVTHYAVLAGNPPDAPQLPHSLAHHRQRFGHPPHTLTGDRGFATPSNDAAAALSGVVCVALPRQGPLSVERRRLERQPRFRRAYRWRAGVEGRISVLARRFGLGRCRYHGEAGLERWVGWGILAHNLRQISRGVASRRAT